MKTVLMHIVTQVLNVLFYLLSQIVIVIYLWLQEWLNVILPSTLDVILTPFMMILIVDVMALFIVGHSTDHFAPSHKKIHLFVTVGIIVLAHILFIATKQVEVFYVIADVIGLSVGTYLDYLKVE